MKLNLKTNSKEQELVKEYLENNASDTLITKINDGVNITKDGVELVNRKDLDGFFSYAKDEARKLVDKGAQYACVSDNVVFGWAIHYFEEDAIEGTLYNLDGTPYKKPIPKSTYKPPVKAVVEKPKPTNSQMSIFDSLLPNDTSKEVAEEKVTEKPKGTPFYQKYYDAQEKHPDAVVIIRLGDFYEAFGDNAKKLSTLLDLTLTGRLCGLEERIPMVGFPYHCSEAYFNKANEHYKLAIVENDKIIIRELEDDEDDDIEELSLEEMQEFDGDIGEEFGEIELNEQDETLAKIYEVFGTKIKYIGR